MVAVAVFVLVLGFLGSVATTRAIDLGWKASLAEEAKVAARVGRSFRTPVMFGIGSMLCVALVWATYGALFALVLLLSAGGL
jgi:hypothetical protein